MAATSADVLAQWVWDDILKAVQNLYNLISGSIANTLDSIKRTVGNIVSSITGALNTLYSNLTRVISGVYNGISSQIAGLASSVQDWLTRLISNMWLALNDVATKIAGPINTLRDRFVDWFGRINSTVEGLGTKVYNAVVNAVNWLGGVLSNAFTSLRSGLDSALRSVGETLANWSRWIGERLSDAARTIGNTLATLSSQLGRSLSEAAGAIGNVLSNVASAIGARLSDLSSNIGRALSGAASAVQNVLNTLLSQIVAAINGVIAQIGRALEGVFEWAERMIIAPMRTADAQTKSVLEFKRDVILRFCLGGYRNPQDFIRDLGDPPPLIGGVAMAIASFVLVFVLQPAIAAALSPAFDPIANQVRYWVQGSLVSPERAVTAYFRGVLSEGGVYDELRYWGYTPERARALVESQRPLLSPGAIQAAFLRGLISEAEHDRLLGRYGYTQEDVRLMRTLYMVLPSVSDLIRMGVREAFSPEIAQRFGQYEDYPAELSQWARQLGLSEEWARRYWAAHWELPSPSQGFEMLHRGIVTEDELRLLLRALDIMPYWREKLIKLSYNPYTRVDVRRMYQLGVLNRDQVYRAYRDLGYDDERARNLTEFTIRYYASEDEDELENVRQLTRSVYVSAYQRGILTRGEAMERLQEIGYLREDAELLLRLADVQRSMGATQDDPGELSRQFVRLSYDAYRRRVLSEAEFRSVLSDLGKTEVEIRWYVALGNYERSLEMHRQRLSLIGEQYQTRVITRSEAQAKLAALGCTPGEINHLLELWDYPREERTRHPSEAQLRAAWAAGIITREEYAEELRGLGYAEKYVRMLVKLAEGRMG